MKPLLRALALVMLVAALAPQGALAQGQNRETLADIRQEMSFLYMEIQRLKQELSTTGNGNTTAMGVSLLDRLDALESEFRRITAKVEDLEIRIQSIVRDGTNRIGDLEFRLVELEGGDVTGLGETSTLGGDSMTSDPVVTPPRNDGNGELAVSEEADFKAAQDALDKGNFQHAADLFARFTEAYPGGPLTPRAFYYQGDALAQLGLWSSAARSYLQAFSSVPDDPIAPDALYRLGVSLDQIGQREEACLTLNEVGARYPGSDAAGKAALDMSAMDCQP